MGEQVGSGKSRGGSLVRTLAVLRLFLIAVLVAMFCLLGAWYLPLADMGGMTVIAHRGDTAHWPENTREAILAAADTGAAGIEFDVQRSAEGTWWIYHDADLKRVSGVAGALADLTDHQVARLPITGGIGKVDGLFHPPRLTPLLADLAGYDGVVIVDVKDRSAEAHAEIARLLTGLSHPMVICRSVAGARAVRAVAPDMPTIGLTSLGSDAALDYRLADARTEITAPWRVWGQRIVAFVHQIDSGREDSEWMDRARRWGVAFYVR
jgi:glycerophosphoryl diester phosphodiesterase